MGKDRKELTTLTFHGPTFEDHGLELDVLSELVQYKKILVETAEELWRKSHPGRERLPRGFKESLQIKFYELGEGSTKIPLFREVPSEGGQTFFDFFLEDELGRAAELIEAGIEAAEEDKPLPKEFPKNVIPLFEYLGRTLGENDFIQAKCPKNKRPARFTAQVRERLMDFGEKTYEDTVDFTGEVRLADLDGLNFVIRIENGAKIPGKFESEHEPKIIEALKEHDTCRLKIKGLGMFSRQEGTIKKVIRVDKMDVRSLGEMQSHGTDRPIWELIGDISAEVPEEEWEKVPKDLSKELDHYLYGSPRSER